MEYYSNALRAEKLIALSHLQPPDESACTDEMGSSGSIQLSLSLDANLGLLTVSLKQAYDLPSKRQDDNPNPYFRVALDIPEGVKTQQQTKTFRATTSPEIGEDFYFQIPAAQIASCRLEIMVYDYDQFRLHVSYKYIHIVHIIHNTTESMV
ncbi:C2 domain protein [Ancylostoma ceylanicum]|uniref:C2 domain protein n=1 Tax=Ancylostoma ceylanicum TaxID=53326 RepID=A0A0D6M2E0_9BILA|nr:C2 domain protein [Ancylostoma ceylanicum]